MAADFWKSTHFKHLIDPRDLDADVHAKDADLGFVTEEIRKIKLNLCDYIKKLALSCKLRERAVATAIAYFRRLYVKHGFWEYDPRLAAPTCLYLACKAEETPIQAKVLVHMIKRTKSSTAFHFEVKQILEMEMYLLEAMEYDLVIFHPHRPLLTFLDDLGLPELRTFAWSLVNDAYKTNMILFYAPHMIALAAIWTAAALMDKDIRSCFEDLRCELNEVKQIADQLITFEANVEEVTDAEIDRLLLRLGNRAIPTS